MYQHRGVGLAANQVNLPFRLFVANEMGNPEEGEELVSSIRPFPRERGR